MFYNIKIVTVVKANNNNNTSFLMLFVTYQLNWRLKILLEWR